MTALMTMWLLSGQTMQILIPARVCELAAEAIAQNGVVTLRPHGGEPVKVTAVMCETRKDPAL